MLFRSKVILNGSCEYAVKPELKSVTEIYWYVEPTGTITVSEVAVAAETVAIVAPKNTILFAGVVLKFVPLIITVVPMGPDKGAKEVTEGVCAFELKKAKNNRQMADSCFIIRFRLKLVN